MKSVGRGLALLTLLVLGVFAVGPNLGLIHASNLIFNPVLNLSNDPAFASDFPRIATSANNVYVAWLNNSGTNNSDVLFTFSGNNGTNFGAPINLSKSLPKRDSVNEQVAASRSYVYVVWQDNTTGNNDIWFTLSSDNGASFGVPVNLSNDPQQSLNPQIAVSGTNVYVTWMSQSTTGSGKDILFSASTNNGVTFSVNKLNLSSDLAANYPVMASSGSNVYVAWQDNSTGAHDIYLKTSPNSGTSFGTVQNLSMNTAGSGTSSIDYQIAAVGSNVDLVWTRVSVATTTDNTMLAASTNSGGSFSAAQPLTTNNRSLHPQVADVGSSVYTVWEDDSIPGVALATFAASSNNGINFNTPVALSSNPGFSQFPQLAAAGTNVYVVWSNSYGSVDVFLRSSNDSGASFGSAVNLSNNPGFSTDPVVVASGNKVYVAWQDDTSSPGIDDILFRTNLTKVNFFLNALQSGWNSTLPPGTTSPCSPSGTPTCNPTATAFKGRPFTIEITWKDAVQHDIAIYANGTTAGNVHLSDTCNLSNTVGCLTVSQPVSSSSTVSVLIFTPTVPNSDFTGLGGFEYFCQYHPSTMHGHVKVYKSPDIDGNGIVNIFDLATIALAYGSTPGAVNWNVAADLDNNGMVNILDVAIAAFYYGQSV